jgi:hypothetical protein
MQNLFLYGGPGAGQGQTRDRSRSRSGGIEQQKPGNQQGTDAQAALEEALGVMDTWRDTLEYLLSEAWQQQHATAQMDLHGLLGLGGAGGYNNLLSAHKA